MKHRAHILMIAGCVVSFAIFGFTLLRAQAAPAQVFEPMSNAGHAPFLNTAQVELPDDLLGAILNALSDAMNPKSGKTLKAMDGTQFVLTSARLEGDWVLVSVGVVDGAASVPGYAGSGEAGRLVIGHSVNGYWLLGIEGAPEFVELLDAAPDDFLSAEAKTLLRPQTQSVNAPEVVTPTVIYKWPWPASSTFYWWQGWHSKAALDMGTTRTDRRVLASAGGVVSFICKGKLGAAIKMKDADGVTLEYWHFDTKLLDAKVKEGAVLEQGQVLGNLRPGTWVDPTCGNQFTQQSANNSHLHWELPKDRAITIDGWTSRYPQNTFTNGNQKRTCNGSCFFSYINFVSSNVALSGQTQLWVAPEVGLVGQGEVITVAVNISNVHNLSAFQFNLNYSPTLLSVNNIWLSDWPGSTGRVFTSAGAISNTAGNATFAAVGTDTALTGTNGAGALAYISLQANAVGTATLQLGSAQTMSATGVTLAVVDGCPGDYDLDGDVNVLDLQRVAFRWNTNEGDANYRAIFDSDNNGRIDVTDLQRIANRMGARCNRKLPVIQMLQPSSSAQVSMVALSDTVAAGDVFTVGLIISDAASLGAFGFSLGYSSTQFEVLSVVLADFPESTARDFTTMDMVTHTEVLSNTPYSTAQFSAYSLGNEYAGASGAGMLAEVTMRALAEGHSALTLDELHISDVEGAPQTALTSTLPIRVINQTAVANEDDVTAIHRAYLPLLFALCEVWAC